jgi:hypothetical protein
VADRIRGAYGCRTGRCRIFPPTPAGSYGRRRFRPRRR